MTFWLLCHIVEQPIDKLYCSLLISLKMMVCIMLFFSLYKRLPWCLKCCAFINLGKINAFTLYTIVLHIKPVQNMADLNL